MRNNYFGFHNDFMCLPESKPGVYAIFLQSNEKHRPRLMYIGSSKNVEQRVYNKSHWYLYLFKRCTQNVILKFIYCENYLEIEKQKNKRIKAIFK